MSVLVMMDRRGRGPPMGLLRLQPPVTQGVRRCIAARVGARKAPVAKHARCSAPSTSVRPASVTCSHPGSCFDHQHGCAGREQVWIDYVQAYERVHTRR